MTFGTLTDIAGIPTAIVNQHNHALYWMQKLDLRNQSLLHIDTHDDMIDGVHASSLDNPERAQEVSCGQYICPAMHAGNVSDVTWYTPNMNLFGEYASFNLRPLATHQRDNVIYWSDPFGRKQLQRKKTTPPMRTTTRAQLKKDYILDIDLDAFSCKELTSRLLMRDLKIDYKNWEPRLQTTMAMIKKIHRPSAIIIARSQGSWKSKTYADFVRYVPKDLVDPIQQRVLEDLDALYN